MIDARGLLCPMPVMLTKKEVKANQPQTLEILVDDYCAVENVTRYGKSCGYTTEVKEEGPDFRLILSK